MQTPFSEQRHSVVIVFLLAAVMLLAGINTTDLQGSTEPREAGIAIDMLLQHQYVVPTLNGIPFLEKPPLSYWAQALSSQLFGINDVAVRLPGVLSAFGILITFACFLRRRAHGTTLFVTSALILLTMASFWNTSRQAGQDLMLAFGITLALIGFHHARDRGRWHGWMAYAAGLAIATMTKGAIGLAIPGIVVLLVLLADALWVNPGLRWRDWVLPAGFALLGLLPLVAWLCALYQQHGVALVKEVLWANSVGRFSGDFAGNAHNEPAWYYLKKLPETFEPWSIPAYAAIATAIAGIRKKDPFHLFLLSWIIGSYLLLSASSGKRPSYLLMVYPAMALLTGEMIIATLARFLTSPMQTHHRTPLRVMAAFVLVLGTASAVVMTLGWSIDHMIALAGAGVATVGLVISLKSLTPATISRYLVGTTLMLGSSFCTYNATVIAHKENAVSARALMQVFGQSLESGHDIALFRPTERVHGAAVFYLHRRVDVLMDDASLERAFRDRPGLHVLSCGCDMPTVAYNEVTSQPYDKNTWHIIAAKTP